MNRSLIRRLSLLFVVLSGIVAMQSELLSQDPFSNDPFSRSARRSRTGDLAEIRFRVVNQDGNPAPGVEIRGQGLVRPLRTNANGEAVGGFDKSRVRDIKGNPRQQVRLHAFPPKTVVSPRASKSVEISKLLESRQVDFKLVPGVLLQGHVVGKNDKEPIERLNVYAYRDEAKQSPSVTSTGKDGDWSLVIPRSQNPVRLVVKGIHRAYRFDRDVDLYARKVTIGPEQSVIEGLDFEIEQIQPLVIHVKDDSGKPVNEARVLAQTQYWADATIGWWNSASDGESTNIDGTCSLFLSDPTKQVVVMVKATVNGIELHGRKQVDPNRQSQGSVNVVLRTRSIVSGKLSVGDKPAEAVPLVLYETVKNRNGKWVSYGVRGETKTDGQGNYQFQAIKGLNFIVATKRRDEAGAQQVLHRTSEEIRLPTHRLPDIDLEQVKPTD